MINCVLKLIIYPPGARGDFVCGWAGLLPNVLDNWWGIDPVTGLSQGVFETKMLDHGSNLNEILIKQDICLDANSELFYVGPCHGFNLDLNLLGDLINSGSLQLYVIDIGNADKSVIAWDCLVKTYLSQRNTVFFKNTHRTWNIDLEINLPYSEITDQHRIEAVKDWAENITIRSVKKYINYPDITILDYTKLFTPGGSFYLCDKLGLDAPQACHNYWDQLLPFIQSPDSITVWNHTWKKQDFFNSKRKKPLE